MKKTFLFLFLTLLCGATFAQTLSWRFANPRILRQTSTGSNLEFDVQVRCSTPGTFLWAATIKFDFNSTTFNTAVANWTFTTVGAFYGFNTKGGLKYTTSYTINGDPLRCNLILTGDPKAVVNEGNSDDFAEIPVDFTTICTVKARLASNTTDALAGLDFYELGMNGATDQQYITTTQLNYVAPCLYDDRSITNAYTGRIYSTFWGWSSLGGSTNNVQYNNWATSYNTTVWEDAAITQNDNVAALASNLYIGNGSATKPVLTIPANKWLTVAGTLTNTGSSANLVIASGGSLINNTSNLPATVERYIDNSKTTWDWHMLSSPVATQAIWPAFVPSPSGGTSYSSYYWNAPYTWDFYYFNPNCPSTGSYWVNYRWTDNTYNYRIPDLANSDAGFGTTTPPLMTVGRGYLVAYSNDYLSAYGYTRQFTGMLNTGDGINLSTANSAVPYILVGNPYSSSIDWQSLSLDRSNLEDMGTNNYAYWIWNEDAGNYGATTSTGGTVDPPGINGTSQFIAPTQAFFVKAKDLNSSARPIIGFNQAARTHSSQQWLKNATISSNTIKLALTSGINTFSDELLVFFDESNSDNNGVDKYASMYNEAPELYAVKEGKNYCIDMHKEVSTGLAVNVSAKCGVAGIYTITAPGISYFSLSDAVYLEDMRTGSKVNLKENNSYSFSGSPNDDRARFRLTFDANTGLNKPGTLNQLHIFSFAKDVYINADQASIGSCDVFIYDAIGKVVYRSRFVPTFGNQKFTTLYAPGAYIVRVISHTGTTTAKIIVH